MKKTVLLFAMLALSGWASSTAHGAIVASYQFTGSSPVADSVAAGITASNFEAGDGLNGGVLQYSTSIGSPAPPSLFASYNDIPTTAFSTNAWLGFSVSPLVGFDLALTSLQFDAQRDGTTPGSTVVSIQVRTSLDGFATSNSLTTFNLNSNSGNFSVNLTQVLAGLLVNPQTLGIRLYLMDNNINTSTTAGFHLDNVRLNGAVTNAAVETPVPPTAVLMAIGLIFPAMKLRRRNQVSTAV